MRMIDSNRGMYAPAATSPTRIEKRSTQTGPLGDADTFKLRTFLWRLRLLRKSLAYKFRPLIATAPLSTKLRPYAEAINDLYFAVVHYGAITSHVRAIVRAARNISPSGNRRTVRMNRIIVSELVKFAITRHNGLGFDPARNHHAAGAIILYNLMNEAGFRPRMLAGNALSTPRIGVGVSLNPVFPARTSIIDISLLAADPGITPESLIDYYDNVVRFRGKPLTLPELAARLLPGR